VNLIGGKREWELKRYKMQKNTIKDLKPRFITSLICLILLFFLIGFAMQPYFKPVFVLALSVISCLALNEYFFIAKSKGIQYSSIASFSAVILYNFSLFFSTIYPQVTILSYVVLALFLVYLFISNFSRSQNALVSLSVTFFGMVYIVLPLSLFILIIYFFPDEPYKGQLWVLYLLVVTKMTDTGGLFTGKFLGKHKLSPKVSPNKTIEGAIGGILLSVAASIVFAYYSSLISVFCALILGFIVSVFAIFGDLGESLLKRDGGIKDSGRNIPGLGGVLDMVDSLIFTTPVLYLFLRLSMDK
jgi:phosphatidate cytidylyltransferase